MDSDILWWYKSFFVEGIPSVLEEDMVEGSHKAKPNDFLSDELHS